MSEGSQPSFAAPAGANRTIDLPAFAVALGRSLRDAGVAATPERSLRFARALELAPPAGRSALYWAARTAYVSSREEVAAFDAVFRLVFDGLADVAETRGDANAPPLEEPGRRAPRSAAPPGAAAPDPAPAAALGAAGEPPAGNAAEREAVLAAASSEERLAEKSFAELDAEEQAVLRVLMRRLAFAPPPRRTRRLRRDRRGERIDLRATLRASRRSGGEPLRLAYRRRRLRPRRLVVICDISGSMEPYARAFLQFLQVAVGGARAEAFVFATRLTRLTRPLQGRRSQPALERAAAAAPDWSGGTRIGEALRRFNDGYGRRGLARGAVVVILSDGWERGDPALVAREMERLRRLAHRVIWVNPRKASPRFAPLAGGMAAALPFCDAVLSGHSLAAMHEVSDAIAAAR